MTSAYIHAPLTDVSLMLCAFMVDVTIHQQNTVAHRAVTLGAAGTGSWRRGLEMLRGQGRVFISQCTHSSAGSLNSRHIIQQQYS